MFIIFHCSLLGVMLQDDNKGTNERSTWNLEYGRRGKGTSVILYCSIYTNLRVCSWS
jgi:hypothetical protein